MLYRLDRLDRGERRKGTKKSLNSRILAFYQIAVLDDIIEVVLYIFFRFI